MTGTTKEPRKTEKKKGRKNAKQPPEDVEDESSRPEDSETKAENEQKEEEETLTGLNVDKKKYLHLEGTADQTDGKKETKVDQNNISTIGVVLIIVLIAVTGLGLFSSSSSKDSVANNIELGLSQLENDYQNQPQFSYKKLRSRMRSYIHHKTSPQPFVLMVASAEDNQQTAECFANRIAKLLTTAAVIINGSKYSDTPSDDAKETIDELLRDEFGKEKFPTAAIIHNFDSIPYGTTSLFYAYCDHDNPMYKEAAIIFTITLPHSYQIGSNEVDREGLVGRYLKEDSPWVKDEKFSMDVMGGLISLITDTIIVVNKESKEALESSC
ncbi:torsin-1A-interacting protein 2-like [Dendronephthya gigantea]|uniref:torsin-1A-interacting protein 2-like n=1 Tax=Dendronephthya gigantea TaxID=151771 RepID=UPI001069FE3A|nr:torsin-1A-interacting protein 2-like [Dendronephthya gigantea]